MPELKIHELVGKRCGKDDRLLILRLLGEGGVGAVFEAVDEQRGDHYAIKFMLESWVHDAEFVRRFRHEGVRWKEIEHPHIVRVHGLGRQFGMPFIISEFVAGRDLEQLVEEEMKLSIEEVLRIGREIASALAEVHRHDIVHRDLKPTNVMVRDDDRAAKLLDFGMAKYMNSDSMLTRPGDIVGTPGFIPPEQLRGGEVNYLADVFALGAMLYEILTGRRAFRGAEVKDALRATIDGTYVPVTRLREDAPRDLAKLIQAMLQANPKKRPADMNEVVGRIEEIERQPAGSAAASRRKLLRWPRRD